MKINLCISVTSILFISTYSFPQPQFHKRLNKDQLRKYFSVENPDDVPDYTLVNIRIRRADTDSTSQGQNSDHHIVRRGQVQPRNLVMVAESLFGHAIQMQLQQNDQLLAPSFKAFTTEGDNINELDRSYYPLCHYLGSNGSYAAAVSTCQDASPKGLSGVVFIPSGSLQLQPVDEDFQEIIGLDAFREKRSHSKDGEDLLHLAFKPTKQKRLSVPDDEWDDDHRIPSAPRSEYEVDDDDIVKYLDFDDLSSVSNEVDEKTMKETIEKRQKEYAKGKDLHLELALFFDEKGYQLFQSHAKSDENLVDMLLGYVNQMQALYHQPSLKRKLHISLVRLDIMKKQPSDLPHKEGERDQLLDSFCNYQAKKNPDSDNDPNHWDLALYVSGLNFYSMEKGKRNGITMGLAPVGGVCMKKHSCVIVELGVTSDDGRPYPSAGLLSTYVAAHEIGHNLGMYHDGSPNNKCPSNGHVMSPSRGTKGETTWSSCSSQVLEKTDKKCLYDDPQMKPSKGLDHSKYNEIPGQTWDAHDQCKVFLRDDGATLYNDTVISICTVWISAAFRMPGHMNWKKLYPFLRAAMIQ